MAWVNYSIGLTPMCTFLNETAMETVPFNTWYNSLTNENYTFAELWNIRQNAENLYSEGQWLFGDTSFGLQVGVVTNTSMQIKGYANGVYVDGKVNSPLDWGGWRNVRLGIACAINEETHKGSVTFIQKRWNYDSNSYNCTTEYSRMSINTDLGYTWLKGYIAYTWQSVPSISGKNGILSLVTLDSESVNDGEPVSGAAVSVFDQAPSNDNNIKNLADTYGGGEASSAVDVTVKYKVTLPPGGIFDVLKLVAKKGSEPEDVTDGDKIVNISANKTKKTVTGLDENSMYYFKIFAEDSNGSTSESNEKHITTSGDEGWSFDYTGQIQTFTAPKTGIYSLETWGAQGGDATDGTNTARGGYGAYAYGEVLLQQGETIYINVGGQNGYGGGGNYDYNDYMIVEPDANGYILDAHAASDGFHDRISGRKMKVIDGNFDNFTYDSTNDWITFGQGCNSLFGFFTKIPEDLLMSITAIDFELEGKWTQTCSSSALKFLGRITLQSDREAYGGTMDCVFVRGGHGDAPALTLTRQNNGSPYWQTVFDSGSVIYDGTYDHWKNLEEVITYHMDLSNGVVTYSSQHCTQGVGAGTRIRANDSDYNNIILNSGDYLKIVCGSLQGFNARAYRIKVTQ